MQGKCPTCQTSLDATGRSASCHTCRGLWVTADALSQMIGEMRQSGDPRTAMTATTVIATIAFVDGPLPASEVARDCPACGAIMRHGRLDVVEIDRCDAHGYWFDADELSEVLRGEHVDPAPTPPPSRGVVASLRAWLRRD